MPNKARSAKVRFQVVRDNSTRSVLRGITQDMQRETTRLQKSQEASAKAAAKAATRAVEKAAKEQERATKAAARAADRATQKSVKDSERASKAAAKAAERAEKAKQRAIAQTAKEEQRASALKVKAAMRAAAEEQRIAERTRRWRQGVLLNTHRMEERERLRAQREADRGMERRRARFGRFGAVAVGATLGAASAGSDLLSRTQSLAGVGSLEERMQTAGQVGTEMIRQSRAAGLSPDARQRVEQKLVNSSVANNVPIVELMAGLSAAQSRFSAFEDFANIIDEIAATSAGTGASVEQLIGALGSAREAFGLTTADMSDAMKIMAAAGAEGAIDADQLANEFAATLASTQRATGRGGIGGLREAIALAEGLGTGQLSAAETSTVQERLLDDLTSKDTQKKLKRIGINTTDKSGAMLPLADIAQQFGSNKKFQSAATRQDIFTDVRGRKGAEILMSLMQKDPAFFSRVQNVTTEQGGSIIGGTRDEIMGSQYGKLQNIGIKAQADTMGMNDELIAKFRGMTESMTSLQMQYPIATETLGMFTGALKGAVAALLAQTLLMGRNTAVGGALASPVSAMGGGAMGKLGMASGVLGAGVAGYQLAKAAGADELGESIGNWLYDKINGASGGAANGQGKTELTVKIDGPGRVTNVTQSPGAAPVNVKNGLRGRNG